MTRAVTEDDVSLEGLRILHVHTLPVISGSGLNTVLTMCGSRDSGVNVGLACAPGGKLEELVKREGMDFFPIRNFVSEIAPFKDLHAFWQLDRLLAREKFDLVHTHNSKAGFQGRLSAKRHRVPIIIHTIHGFAFHDQESWLLRRLFVLLERMAARWCHHLIAISGPMIDWAEHEQIAPLEKIDKIFSGIDVEAFRDRNPNPEFRKRFGLEPGDIVIGIVSKLWEGKGHSVLIEAAAHLLDKGYRIKLLIIGEGVLEKALRDQATALGIEDSVIFTGFLLDVPEVTAILDISVLPSFFEGMGRVVLEAMAAGKPVIASRVGGLPELVEDQVTGYLIPPGDISALEEKLEILISDSELRSTMGKSGTFRVGEEHSAQKMVELIHEVYLRKLREAGKAPAADAISKSVGLRDHR